MSLGSTISFVLFLSMLLNVGVLWAQPLALTEDDALSAAIANSPALKQAEAELHRAEADLAAARPFFANRPEGSLTYETGAPFGDEDQRIAAGITQQLEIGGQQGIRREIARLEIKRATLARQAALNSLRLEIRLLFTNVVTLSRLQELSDSLVATAGRVSNAAHRRLEVGDIPKLEYNSILLDELRQRSLHDKGLAALEAALAELKIRIGSATNIVIDTAQQPTSLKLGELLDSSLRYAPQVLSRRAELERRYAEVRLARAERIPNPTIGVEFSRSRLQFGQNTFRGSPAVVNQIKEIRKQDYGIGLSLSIPLPLPFLWPTGTARVNQAEAEAAISEAQLQATERQTEIKIQALRTRLHRLEEALVPLRLALAASRENAVFLERGYLAGELNATQYLAGRQQLFDAESQNFELTRELTDTRSEILSISNR